jgi:hypothetical protein
MRTSIRFAGLVGCLLGIALPAGSSYGNALPRQVRAALPVHRLTPGGYLHVKKAALCRPSYGAHLGHASARVTRQSYARYGLQPTAHAYKVDHLVPVGLGGSNAIANLWPQRYGGQWGVRKKDRLEKRLHGLVCAGKVGLRSARRQLARNWIAAYKLYVRGAPGSRPSDTDPPKATLPGQTTPAATPPGTTTPGTTPTPGSPPTVTKPTAPGTGSPPAPPRIYWGAYIDGGQYGLGNPPWDMRSISTFEAHAGKAISILHFGNPWYIGGVPQPFAPLAFNLVRQHGAIPMVSWASWDLSNGGVPNQPSFSLGRIIDGTYDSFIRSWASGARAWGHPFFLRFDHEMNGTWYPWNEGKNGNTAGQYVAAWRHVHDIFTAVGATNVSWVWCPNSEYRASLPLDGLFPGNAYIDWTCVDSYNFGTNPVDGEVWRSFADGVGPTYNHLLALAPSKPVMVGETASTEFGGSKAAWITTGLASLPTLLPRVKAVLWFDWPDGGHDWSIESSASAQAAFAAAIASPYFAPNQFGAIEQSPIPSP